MFKKLKKKNKAEKAVVKSYYGPKEGAYIIGDIHGCYDQMADVLRLIRDDIQRRNINAESLPDEEKPKIIFLGDLIDRGPRSKDVVEALLKFNPKYAQLIFLMGNHEEVFLKVLDGEIESFKFWCQFGGKECMRSYGVTNLGEINYNPEALLRRFQETVEQSHIDFISSFRDHYLIGDYLCVHAGIRPKVPLKDQKSKDMMWIRESFLTYTKPHEYRVIHGHTISEEPVNLPNRIGIDTGVYNGNPLTCVFIQNEEVRFIRSSKSAKKD